mmetsp:Transcript_53821/g.117773  ORF Transcript_53821/g.117773 Transcript_53821/m.117773 type:complete len:225 (+) Transcript_53821:22-696(+)
MMRIIIVCLCTGLAAGKTLEPFDNADIPSWIPGCPGIDQGTIYFTYAKDLCEVVLLLLFGWFYKRRITSKRPALPMNDGAEDFRTGVFSCCMQERGCNCFWAFFMQQVRMGDTFQASGVTSFWAPTAVFVASRIIANLMGLVPGMPAGLPTTSMFFFQAVFYARWRNALRRELSLPRNDCGDFCLYSLCAPCLAAQEANEIDRLSGVYVGCFKIEIVGQPLIAR